MKKQEERHEQYFILYKDKYSDWEEIGLYLPKENDDLKTFIKRAEELVDEGHRNVRVMEEVAVERIVKEVQ